jgi:hypothetical protein
VDYFKQEELRMIVEIVQPYLDEIFFMIRRFFKSEILLTKENVSIEERKVQRSLLQIKEIKIISKNTVKRESINRCLGK